MYDNNSKGISYTAGFFILIGFAIAGLLIGGAISIPIWTSMTGLSIADMQGAMTNPKYSHVFKIMQLISVVFGFLIPTLGTAALLNRKPLALLGLRKRITGMQVVAVLLLMLAALLVASGLLGWINQKIPLPPDMKAWADKLEKQYADQMQAMVQLKNLKDYLWGWVILGFLPAVCEEFIFRGGLQNFLARSMKSPWAAIIIVSIIFSLFHASWYGFLPRVMLGIVLGLIFHYTGSLWLCIIAHFLNNILALTVLYYYSQQGKTMDDMAKQNPSWVLGLVAVPVVIALVMFLIRISPRNAQAGLSLNDVKDKAPWER